MGLDNEKKMYYIKIKFKAGGGIMEKEKKLARRKRQLKQITINIPVHLLEKLEKDVERLGVNRNHLIIEILGEYYFQKEQQRIFK
jgi:transcriptional regulator of met regulon